MRASHLGHLVEVDDLTWIVRVVRGRRHSVGDEVPHLRGDAGRRAVRQVAAVVEPHGQHGVPRIEEGLVHGEVGVGAGMGLDVGVLRPEEGLEPIPGEVFDLVDDLIASVVATARIALGVLVGQHRACGSHDRGRGEVLGGDQLHRGRLALGLGAHQRKDLRVLGDPPVEGRCGHGAAHEVGCCLSGLSLERDASVAPLSKREIWSMRRW